MRVTGATLAGAALAALLLAPLAAGASPATNAERIAKGFRIAPVPLNLTGLDRNLVGMGSYLVNAVSGCNDCHSVQPFAPGGDPYLGQPKKTDKPHYLAGGRAFGPFVAPNLTPDAQGRPAGLTQAQFIQVMRTGKDPDNPSVLLQVMPWPVYQDMAFDDLKAIYAYLRAVPSRPFPTP